MPQDLQICSKIPISVISIAQLFILIQTFERYVTCSLSNFSKCIGNQKNCFFHSGYLRLIRHCSSKFVLGRFCFKFYQAPHFFDHGREIKSWSFGQHYLELVFFLFFLFFSFHETFKIIVWFILSEDDTFKNISLISQNIT